MGLIDLLFGQSKCKNMNDIKLRNDDIPDWMLNEFPHWPGMTIPHKDTTTVRYAKRYVDGNLESKEVSKCSDCPFSIQIYVGLTKPSQSNCHHPSIVSWDNPVGKPYLYPFKYESFPNWCPLLTCNPPVFKDGKYI